MNFITMIVFYSTLLLSPVVVISSSNVAMMWLGLELSTFSFLPVIFSSAQSTFSTMKYFFVQSIASVLVLISIFFSSKTFSVCFLFIAFMIKLGLVPFHFWLPSLVSSLQAKEILILLVWQKIGPLFVISFLSSFYTNVKLIVGLFSVVVGSILGLKQTQWKQIFTFSSISHLGWLLVSMGVSFWLFLIYFLIYSVSFFQVMFSLSYSVINSSVLSFSNLSLVNLMMILSLAGLPPMLGFLAKLMVLSFLTLSNFTAILSIALLFFSMVSMFFYLKIFFSLTLSYSSGETVRSNLFILSSMIIFLSIPLMLNF